MPSNRPSLMRTLITILLAMLVIGCSSVVRQQTREERLDSKPKKIKAEAYLYDVKVFQQGKKTSLRFEIYLTDSIAGLSAKGYLGKGALKGWLTRDSIAVFFPTMDEYLYDAVSTLLAGKECSKASNNFGFLSIFANLPNSDQTDYGLQIELDSTNSKRPVYTIRNPNCDWRLDLEYDHRKVGPRLRKFEFDNGRGDRFTGKRRKFKSNAKIPEARFKLAIPASARRITL